MFPNPQDAFPLPSSPSVAQYRKLAKDLVKACKAGDAALAAWVDGWVSAGPVRDFVAKTMRGKRDCVLADAQFVIARAHGFLQWATFVAHLEALANAATLVAAFEAAADAIVRGDEQALRQLLQQHPALIHARSTREHNATLLHYVSANGVENYRQKSPANAARITELLLAAGADIEAEANVYGGGCTALGLVATSTPPRQAGVQIPVMQVLLDRGAEIEHPNLAGNNADAVYACLANGCPEAAGYFVERGARLGLIGAAGIGRLDVVEALVDGADASRREMALRYAAGYGQLEVVKFLLDRGVNVDGDHGDGKTALYYARLGKHAEIVELLLARGAREPSPIPY